MAEPQSITNVEESPKDDRRTRMLRYTIAMTIRVVCIILAMVVQGWLMWLFFAGAIFLPYFAVVIANGTVTQQKKGAAKVIAPTLTIGADAFTTVTNNDSEPQR